MKTVICLIIGYLMGCLSPSALLSKIKKINMREKGTGNLGATNAMMVFGKGYGVAVMLFDIFKAYFASGIAKWLFPAFTLAGLIAGGAAVVGHVFPFYLHFKGGKGLAAFGGMIMGYNVPMFLVLLTTGCVLILLTNYSVLIAVYAAILFPILAGFHSGSWYVALVILPFSALLLWEFRGNFRKIREGKEMKVRNFLKGN